MTMHATAAVAPIIVELGTESAPALIRWSVRGRASYWLHTAQGPVLIDPQVADSSGIEQSLALPEEVPIATVLTNDWHERDAYRLRDRWGTPVWAPAAGLPERGGELEGTPDHVYDEGTALPGGLRAQAIQGAFAGEHLLWWRAPTGEGVLFTGDAVNGQAAETSPVRDDWRTAPGLYLGVAHYYSQWLANPSGLRESLRPALDEEFDLLCGSHARPYRNRAREALAQLLAQDWPAILRTGGRPAVYPRLLEACQYGRRQSFPLVEQRDYP